MKKNATSPPRRSPAPPTVVERELFVGFWPAAGVFLLFPLVFFLSAFLPGEHIYGTDYIGGGYFFYDFVTERLSEGALPKWVPYVFGGMPLFANPGSTFQPVHFITDLLLPTSRVLAGVFVVQFWLAGLGMYLFARELGCRSWVALVAGFAFQFTGIVTSWVYAGHDGRIIVATLTPFFFYFLHWGIRTARPAPFAGAAVTLGFALLSFQIQNSYYLLLAAGIWGVYCLFHWGWVRRPPMLVKVSLLGLGAVAVGFLLAAVNFLPFLSYVSESPRGMEGGRGYEYATSFSMPPAEILSLAVPEHHGVSIADPQTGRPLFPPYRGTNPFKLHTEYTGAFVIMMLVIGGMFAVRDRRWWFFAGLAAFMMTIALGGNTPLYRLYFEVLPGTQRFRAPSLSFFVVAFSLVSMAAIALERLAQLRAAEQSTPASRSTSDLSSARLVWGIGAVVGLPIIGMLLTAGGDPASAAGGPSVAMGWARFAFFCALIGAALWMWVRRSASTTVVAIALAVITVADLWIVGRRFFHTVDPPEVIFAADDVVNFLLSQPQPNRVWTFPYPEHYRGAGTYGGNYPMLFGIEQVGGEHPNMLQRWVEYVGAGTRTYIDWHNLIDHAEVVSTADGPAIAFRGQPGFLEAANVRFIVSMAPLTHPALREVHRGSALVYEHTGALPRAYLVPQVNAVPNEIQLLEAMRASEWDPAQTAFVSAAAGVDLAEGPLQGEARILLHEPDRVVIHTEASRSALLVLADNYYDGWRAETNGQALEVLLVNNTFRGVVVPSGEHTVEFTFEPPSLYTGLWISLAGFVLLLLYGGYLLIRYVRQRELSAEGA